MRPDKISIYELFDRQRRYAVPLYQRQYVWTQDAQWLPLWEDIEDKARAVQAGEAKAPHFLGAIVTSQRQVFGNEINSWEIIDGQQRLTTLQVVFAAFRDVINATGHTKYALELQRVTRNDGVMKDEAVERFKVWPTNSDRAAFAAIMSAGSLSALAEIYPGLKGRQKRRTPRLAEAYAYFHRTIERFLDDEDDPATPGTVSARADALFETFRRYLQIVNIELENGDDPQVIFESLNGRGVPLLPSDLVRNFVFMRASGAGANLDTLYGQYWKPYDERVVIGSSDEVPWWKQEERQGRLKRARLDLFLFHYLQYRLESEVNIGHLFQEFRNWWDRTSGTNPSDALADMQRYAAVFAAWMQADGTDRVAEFARWLKVLDTSTLYPVMFFLVVEQADRLPRAEIEGIVTDLESYLIRRAVCGLTNKQYNRFFIGLLKKLRSGVSVSREGVRSYLSAGKGHSVRWPDDEDFGRAFIHRPAYRVLKREVANRVLLSLEHALRTAMHEKVEISGKLSIEHVMPQEWKEAWPLYHDSDEARERRERLIHAFGNLTLVTQAFNTSLSNKGFVRKQKELKRIARLLLSHSFEELTQWDEEGILSRGRDLFDEARRLWPHPTSPETLDLLPLDSPPEASWSTGRTDEDGGPVAPPIQAAAAATLLDRFVELRAGAAKAGGPGASRT